MLVYHDLFAGRISKIDKAIERIKFHEPPEGYYLAFSGGKDSIVIKRLADIAGVKYDAHFNLTTIDPPELVHFIKKYHPDVVIERPKIPLTEMMIKKGFPMRNQRWCCEIYKERTAKNRIVLTGVRWAESFRRAKRSMIESCYKRKKTYLHPIIDWTDADVWDFIKKENIPYCSLYDEGFKRIGCVLCPLASGNMAKEAKRWPKIAQRLEKTFIKIYNHKKAQGKDSISRWKDGKEMFLWWLYQKKDMDKSQLAIFE
jgi:phosphoadenosine phosphosulfate reductase